MPSLSVRLNTLSRQLLVVLAMFVLVATVSGCSGCWKDDTAKKEEEEKKKKKKKDEVAKPDFEMARIDILPSDRSTAASLMKAGHWVMASQVIKANHFDFQADLQCDATDKNGVPFEIPHTPFSLSTSRPVALPKGQAKILESLHFAPLRQKDWRERNLWIRRELATARGGRVVAFDSQGVTYLPTYQYLFLVLAAEPDLYGYVRQLTAVTAPSADFNAVNTDGRFSFYQVVSPNVDKVVPLPANALTMTSLAYILWDGIDPKLFATDQAESLVDWLHWGGQLLVSGPDSLDALRGSFLDPYLPATKGESQELTNQDFESLNRAWSIPDEKTGQPRALTLSTNQPLLGVKLIPHAEASDIGGTTGGLVWERRVGNGRIVVTGFPLAARELIRWGGSFDSFFNNGLMRRPRRRFVERDGHLAHMEFADHPDSLVRDARFVSAMRFFSRDAGHVTNAAISEVLRETGGEGLAAEDVRPDERARPGATVEAPSTRIEADVAGELFGGYLSMPQSGVAGWNDRSGVADKARDALKDAAGISIPNSRFVFKILAVYLLILAPLNFGFFWLIRRVEWAWVAAPVFAIIGAIAVVRLAQLDIGFARSVTEVATLEVHGGYPHGHLTRFTGLYTSLSTSYDMEFDQRSSLALPFPADPKHRPQESASTVRMRRDRQLALRGFQVPSNKTGMIHSEQMLDLEGSIALRGGESSGWELQNQSFLSLREVAVLRRDPADGLQVAWVGDLPPQSSPSLRFAVMPGDRPSQWDESSVMASYDAEGARQFVEFDRNSDDRLGPDELRQADLPPDLIRRFDTDKNGNWSLEEFQLHVRKSHAGELSLGALADIAVRRLKLKPGEMRLVGWTDQGFPGVAIKPSAAQGVRRTLAMVHLAHASYSTPRRDENAFRDVFKEKKLEEEEDNANKTDSQNDNENSKQSEAVSND